METMNSNKVGPKSRGKKALRQVLTTVRRTLKNGKCSKGQLRTALLLSRMLNNTKYTHEVTWDWLETRDYTLMYLDIYFPKYKLAVEYHGEQHYKFPNFFHKSKRHFLEAKKRDKLKKQLIKEHGFKFIEWKYNEPFTERRAYSKLIKAGVPANSIKNPSPTPRRKKDTKISYISPRRR